MKKFWLILISVLAVIGVLIFAGIQIERHVVVNKATTLLPIVSGTHTTGVDLKNVELAPKCCPKIK